jgi:DNA-binding response OmpR family regulator
MSASKRILIVEDEMMIALHIEDTLGQLGHDVSTATTLAQAEHLLDEGHVDLAIVDYKLTDGNTEALMERLAQGGVPFIICSGIPDEEERRKLNSDTRFLPKPFTSDALIDAVAALTSRYSADELH